MATLSEYERGGEYLLLLRCNLKNVIKNNGLLWHLNECWQILDEMQIEFTLIRARCAGGEVE